MNCDCGIQGCGKDDCPRYSYSTVPPRSRAESAAPSGVSVDTVWNIVRPYIQSEAQGRTFERLQMAFINSQLQPGRVEGMVLVPVESTPGMIEAAERMADDLPLSDWGKIVHATPAQTYAAMLAAAPTASSQEPDHG